MEDFSHLHLPFHSQKALLSLHWQVLLAQYEKRAQSSIYIQGRFIATAELYFCLFLVPSDFI